ncbi:hypothetical protein N9T44_02495 [Candidatus Pelagibacter sp.]|jgi:hypothetical protein|nr:hypothetical protein [Candidatus Pelagibacter sp.]
MKKKKLILPVWAWVVILVLLLQIGKLAYRNDWFKADKTIKKEQDLEKINKKIKELKKESSK